MPQVVRPQSGELQLEKDYFEQGYFGEEGCWERERTGPAVVVAWGGCLAGRGNDLRLRCWGVTGNGLALSGNGGLWGGMVHETGNVHVSGGNGNP